MVLIQVWSFVIRNYSQEVVLISPYIVALTGCTLRSHPRDSGTVMIVPCYKKNRTTGSTIHLWRVIERVVLRSQSFGVERFSNSFTVYNFLSSFVILSIKITNKKFDGLFFLFILFSFCFVPLPNPVSNIFIYRFSIYICLCLEYTSTYYVLSVTWLHKSVLPVDLENFLFLQTVKELLRSPDKRKK